jgi:hypothetical protein
MEKIDKVQFPLPYAQIVKLLTFIYVFGLPFALVPQSGYLTPVIVLFAATGFYGLDEVAEVLESPFGEDPNDIHLDIFIERLIDDLDHQYFQRQTILNAITTGKVDEEQPFVDRQNRIPSLKKQPSMLSLSKEMTRKSVGSAGGNAAGSEEAIKFPDRGAVGSDPLGTLGGLEDEEDEDGLIRV